MGGYCAKFFSVSDCEAEVGSFSIAKRGPTEAASTNVGVPANDMTSRPDGCLAAYRGAIRRLRPLSATVSGATHPAAGSGSFGHPQEAQYE